MPKILQLILILAGLLAAYAAFQIPRHRRLQHQAEAALAEAFGDHRPLPRLQMTYPYGFPNFTLFFADDGQIAAASQTGAIERFMAAIAILCRDKGSAQRPFDVRAAVRCATEPRAGAPRGG